MDQVLYYLIVREHGITNKCNNNTGEAERETSELDSVTLKRT